MISDPAAKPSRELLRGIKFLPGHNGEVILAWSSKRVIYWNAPLYEGTATKIAEFVPSYPIEDLTVNEDQSHITHLVISGHVPSPNRLCFTKLRVDVHFGYLEQQEYAYVPIPLGEATIYALCGDWLVAGNGDTFLLMNLDCRHVHIMPQPIAPGINNPGDRVLCVKMFGEYIIVVFHQSFVLAKLPSDKLTLLIVVYGEQLIREASEAAVSVQMSRDPRGWRQVWPPETISVVLRCEEEEKSSIQHMEIAWPHQTNQGGVQDFADSVRYSKDSKAVCVAPWCRGLLVGPSGRGVYFHAEQDMQVQFLYPKLTSYIVGFELIGLRKDIHTEREPDLEGVKHQLVTSSQKLCMRERTYTYTGLTNWNSSGGFRGVDFEDSVGRLAVGDDHGVIQLLSFG